MNDEQMCSPGSTGNPVGETSNDARPNTLPNDLEQLRDNIKAFAAEWRYGKRDQGRINIAMLRALESIEKIIQPNKGDRT